MATLENNALTTDTRVKEGIDDIDSSYDNLIIQLINEVSSYFESFCDRKFLRQNYVEKYDGWDSYENPKTRIFLNNFPVDSVNSVKDEQSDGTFEALDTDDYRLDPETGIIRVDDAQAFRGGYQNHEIDYDAGYLIDFNNVNDDSSHTLPKDLTWACEKVVRAEFQRRDDVGKQSVGEGPDNITFLDDLPRDVKSVLRKYKDMRAL